MARPTGVMIVSERYWAFAGIDGSLTEGQMSQAYRTFSRVPVVRGLARLAASLSPLFRRSGVGRERDRAVVATALVLPLPLALLPERVSLATGIVLTVGLLVWLLRGRTLFLHGAEHRAIAAAERRELASTWAGVANPSRFARRCGTNFAALLLPTMIAAQLLWPFPSGVLSSLALTLLTLGVTMELWLAVQASPDPINRAFLAPGLALQRLTTREPSLEETRHALRGVASVLEREVAART